MEEIVESEKDLEVAEQGDTVESTDNQEQEVETVENTEQTETPVVESDEEETIEEKPLQSEEDNKVARLARIQAEKVAESKIEQARKEAYEKGIAQGKIDSFIGKQNPYTGETIKDEYDVKEYQDMYQLELAGKDPIKDFRTLQKSKAKEDAKKQLELDSQLKQEQWYKEDTKAFVDKYGQDKLQELTADKDFDIFANGKVGKQPLGKIYEDYQKLINKYEKKSVETAKSLVANNATTPGKVDSGEAKTLNWSNMSDDKFEEYLRRAKDGELR